MLRLALIALVACGDNTPAALVIMDVSDVPPAYGRAPFPNDAVRETLGLGSIPGLDKMTPSQAGLIGAHLAGLDGWGLRPPIEFFIDGAAIDPATVPDTTSALDSAIVVVEVDNMAPVPYDWRYDADRKVIAGSPHLGFQLAEGTT